MKKATFEAIKTALTAFGYDNQDVMDELTKEINKGAEQKAKNAEAIEDEVPEGITKGKVQYALTHLWGDEIVKVEGKPNGYRKAV